MMMVALPPWPAKVCLERFPPPFLSLLANSSPPAAPFPLPFQIPCRLPREGTSSCCVEITRKLCYCTGGKPNLLEKGDFGWISQRVEQIGLTARTIAKLPRYFNTA